MSGNSWVMKIMILIVILAAGFQSSASLPSDSVGVETISGVRFIRHQVVNGEGWYSIARKYGISYSELRLANKDIPDQLIIGQTVLIPGKAKVNDPRFQKNYIDKSNVDTPVKKAEPEQDKQTNTGKKKTHTVIASETLFSISNKYSISVEQLKSMNQLTGNTISVGQVLVVGTQDEEEKTVKKTDSTPPVEVIKKDSHVESAKIPTVKEAGESAKVEDALEKKETTIILKTAEPEKSRAEENKNDKKYSFANGRQEIKEQGLASWIEDEDINPNKYYALHRTAPIGTIIKVTNIINDSSVFVKVVGILQETNDNEGLVIKISKASADRLNVLDKKFQADLIYGVTGN